MPEEQQPERKPRRSPVAFVADMWRAGRSERVSLLFWVVLIGFGLYLIGTGIVGILTKAQ